MVYNMGRVFLNPHISYEDLNVSAYEHSLFTICLLLFTRLLSRFLSLPLSAAGILEEKINIADTRVSANNLLRNILCIE